MSSSPPSGGDKLSPADGCGWGEFAVSWIRSRNVNWISRVNIEIQIIYLEVCDGNSFTSAS
jgi:hypothetical protein